MHRCYGVEFSDAPRVTRAAGDARSSRVRHLCELKSESAPSSGTQAAKQAIPILMAEAAPAALMHSLLRAKDPTRRVTVPSRPADTDVYPAALERLIGRTPR